MAEIKIRMTFPAGPMMSQGASGIVRNTLDEACREVIQTASAGVHTILNARIKHPTPYYETQITVETMPGTYIVHDRGIVYGPWLEGTSGRNQVTRFKGYHAFSESYSIVADSADDIVEPFFDRARAKLDGQR
jgi:hypothetical protein